MKKIKVQSLIKPINQRNLNEWSNYILNEVLKSKGLNPIKNKTR